MLTTTSTTMILFIIPFWQFSSILAWAIQLIFLSICALKLRCILSFSTRNQIVHEFIVWFHIHICLVSARALLIFISSHLKPSLSFSHLSVLSFDRVARSLTPLFSCNLFPFYFIICLHKFARHYFSWQFVHKINIACAIVCTSALINNSVVLFVCERTMLERLCVCVTSILNLMFSQIQSSSTYSIYSMRK